MVGQPESRFASKNLNIIFFYVLNLDIKVTHVGLDGTDKTSDQYLTLVLLNPDIPCLCNLHCLQ